VSLGLSKKNLDHLRAKSGAEETARRDLISAPFRFLLLNHLPGVYQIGLV